MIIPLPRYAELAATTNFSFLRGASHPEELVAKALELGHCGMGLADRNSVAGVVRAFSFLRAHKVSDDDFKLAVGARLVFADKTPEILCYPRDRAAYGRLCLMLTRGNMRAQKGDCALVLDDLLEFGEGQQLVALGEAAPPPRCARRSRAGCGSPRRRCLTPICAKKCGDASCRRANSACRSSR